mmetsp:Transcript_3694/g.9478  ORF Transcript_3694/g.9478 Transcript_3694/m.9478 type:complete len:496 (-) Transcript_3694:27-1514(-)
MQRLADAPSQMLGAVRLRTILSHALIPEDFADSRILLDVEQRVAQVLDVHPGAEHQPGTGSRGTTSTAPGSREFLALLLDQVHGLQTVRYHGRVLGMGPGGGRRAQRRRAVSADRAHELLVPRGDPAQWRHIDVTVAAKLQQEGDEESPGLATEPADHNCGRVRVEQILDGGLHMAHLHHAGRIRRGVRLTLQGLHGAAAKLQGLPDVPGPGRDLGGAELDRDRGEDLGRVVKTQPLAKDLLDLIARVRPEVHADNFETAGHTWQHALRQVHRVGDSCYGQARARYPEPLEHAVQYGLVARHEVIDLVDQQDDHWVRLSAARKETLQLAVRTAHRARRNVRELPPDLAEDGLWRAESHGVHVHELEAGPGRLSLQLLNGLKDDRGLPSTGHPGNVQHLLGATALHRCAQMSDHAVVLCVAARQTSGDPRGPQCRRSALKRIRRHHLRSRCRGIGCSLLCSHAGCAAPRHSRRGARSRCTLGGGAAHCGGREGQWR